MKDYLYNAAQWIYSLFSSIAQTSRTTTYIVDEKFMLKEYWELVAYI